MNGKNTQTEVQSNGINLNFNPNIPHDMWYESAYEEHILNTSAGWVITV